MLKPFLDDIKKSRAAQQLIQEGKIAGKIAGKMEGKKEGMKEGIVHAKYEVAAIMLKDGMKYDQVKKYTGLSRKELEQLQV